MRSGSDTLRCQDAILVKEEDGKKSADAFFEDTEQTGNNFTAEALANCWSGITKCLPINYNVSRIFWWAELAPVAYKVTYNGSRILLRQYFIWLKLIHQTKEHYGIDIDYDNVE